MNKNQELENYKKELAERLAALNPVFAKAAIGDFSEDVLIPEQEDELSEFFVGIQIMLEVIREKTAELEHINTQTLGLLNSTIDTLIEGILVVDPTGKIAKFNQQFVKMWGIPLEIVNSGDDNKALEFVTSQLKNPEQFISKVKQLYKDVKAESFDLLEFNDGRIVERYSKPYKIESKPSGRVWSFIDVTERTKARADLENRMADIERMNKLLVGRELRMIELKEEIKRLKQAKA